MVDTIITFEEFEAIARSYGLGKITASPEIEEGGAVNHLFKLSTDRDTYMVRVRTGELAPHQREKKIFEYVVTDFLHDTEFEYGTPHFLPNEEGEKLTFYPGKEVDVYIRLPGVPLVKGPHINPEVIEAVARCHRAMADFPLETKPTETSDVYDEKGLLYSELLSIEERVANPKTEVDALMKGQMDFLKKAYASVRKHARPNILYIVVHNDIHLGNILGSERKVTGIIDFGNVKLGSKEQDLIKLTTGEPTELADLVREYRRHNPLSDQEVANIIPEKIFKMLHGIKWVYQGMRKNPELRKQIIEKQLIGLRRTMAYFDSN